MIVFLWEWYYISKCYLSLHKGQLSLQLLPSCDPHVDLCMEVRDTEEARLAACENLNEDEMPEHLTEMGISAEHGYQERT